MLDQKIVKLAVTSAALALAVTSTVASAAECIFDFPTISSQPGGGPVECRQGSSSALVAHGLTSTEGFSLYVDFASGTIGAAAYGIDENGTRLSRPETTVADRDRRFEEFEGVPASDLYGPEATGTIPSARFYDHPLDMVATYVAVF